MGQSIRWCVLACAICERHLLVPLDVLRRIADDRTFITCVACGDRLEAEGRATRFDPGAFALPGSSVRSTERSEACA